jgi:hypothetical protein
MEKRAPALVSSFVWALMRRKKLNLMSADSQFQMIGRYPANLDRCRRCGTPRKMHGADGSCGLTFSMGSEFLARLITAGCVLAALGGAAWLLASTTAITVGSLVAFACLVALILLVSGTAIAGRRR